MKAIKKRKKSEEERRSHKKTPHVPGQYLGYSLQTTRFLARLLEAELDWTVSLEVFEDVGVETSDGKRIAEQEKSTYDGNPVSDRAVGLWKTFSNWIDAVERGDLPSEKTSFEIYVSQPKTGDIVRGFSDARSLEEARRAFIKAREKLWGSAPDFDLKSKVSDSIETYVSRVFKADENVICKIIKAFTLTCGSGSPQADLKVLIGKAFVPLEIIDDTLRYAMGWVKVQIDCLIEQKKAASIGVKTFHSEITSFVRKHDRRTILISLAQNPDQEEIEADLKLKTYVRQLEIIGCDYNEKVRAVSDFLRASADRTQWSVKGWVHDSSFDEFENSLVRTWENQKRKTDIIMSSHKHIEKGQYLYSECSLHQAKLEGLEVPSHFTPGSFHALAEKEEIGWHPDYKTELRIFIKRKGQ